MAPKYIPLLSFLLVFSTMASGLTVNVDDMPKTPEVILAPGLPTLKELGLTSADLYKEDFLGD
jgi:hypothetical protein